MKRHTEGTEMKKLLIIILSLMLTLTVWLGGCGQVKSSLGLGPKPEIVGREVYDTVVEGDYSVVVKVDIVNQGRGGDIEVLGEVWWQGNYWKKSKVVYLPADAGKEVSLLFKGPTFLGSVFGVLTGQPGFKYRAQVKPH